MSVTLRERAKRKMKRQGDSVDHGTESDNLSELLEDLAPGLRDQAPSVETNRGDPKSPAADQRNGSNGLEALRVIRAVRGLSLKAAAKQAGMSPAYLQKLECGEIKAPSPHKLHQLANAYSCPYSTLMSLAGYLYPEVALENSDNGSGRDSLDVLRGAIGGTELAPDEAEWVARSLREYRETRDAGVHVSSDFLATVMTTYRRLRAANGPMSSDDLAALLLSQPAHR